MAQNCKVVISPNPIRTREVFDINGNIINPATKQIIKLKEPDYIPPVATPPPIITPEAKIEPTVSENKPSDILSEIEQTKAKLAQLEEAKKTKIAEMEKELNKLKNI